jgi:hypothetical protein
MRVVVDTNVIFSGLVFGGNPALVLKSFDSPSRTLLLTDHILRETETVLRSKSGWDDKVIARVLADLVNVAEWIKPASTVSECRDPDDNRILEAALAGSADCIVTGDADLLSMRSFRGMQIVSVAAFLARLNSGGTP